ncbi:MAG TPA: winged helix-turn-helix transcriptional regulator [Actinomycetota bacterium]|nr:winged helix-turn-helix transcriptional regulator [Actinomycetota bacterium]
MTGKDKRYGQFCPVARSLDVVGDRWTLLIIRDLLRGKQRFKDLQGSLQGIAPNLLSDRLKRLEQKGLVVRRMFKQIPPKVEYTLTAKGQALESVLQSLARFGMSMLMTDPVEGDLIDPELIFQAMPAAFKPEEAGDLKVSVAVRLTGDHGGEWTVHIEDAACRIHEGADSEAQTLISTDELTWARIATGTLEPEAAARAGAIKIEGDRELAKRFPHLFVRAPLTPEEAGTGGQKVS